MSSRGGGAQQAAGKKRRHPQADVQGQQQPRQGGYQQHASAAAASAGGSAMALDSGSGGGAPRTLHVLEFAEARAREIASLTHILSGGGSASPTPGGGSGNGGGGANPAQISGGGRRVFQSLPRHMRRRAMSHNIKRLPQRLQGAAQREMDKIVRSSPPNGGAGGGKAGSGGGGGDDAKPKGPSRRVRRRPHNVLALHAHRMGVHQWLETHIWHAKRMKMDNRWGYKLALNPTDRSLRACYNAGVHLCTAYDASIVQVLSVFGPDAHTIAAALAPFVPPNDLTALLADDVVSGRCETTVRMHQPGAMPYDFITHAKCQWQPLHSTSAATVATPSQQQRQLWLWLHPSVYALVQSLLQTVAASAPAASSGLRVVPLLGELCRLELRGFRCQAVLRMAIREVQRATGTAAGRSSPSAQSDSKEDAEMTDASASAAATGGSGSGAVPASPASIGVLLSSYNSPALFLAHRIFALQAQHPELMRPTPSQPFQLQDATREKQRGAIIPFPRNSTFTKAADAQVRMQLTKEHQQLLYGAGTATNASSSTTTAPAAPSAPLTSASPLFDADFRRLHTRETRWGAKKQRYARIARKEVERRRRMHERRANDTAAAIATAADSGDDDEGAVSDSVTMLRRRTTSPAKKQKPVSKDDLDMGTSATPLLPAQSAGAGGSATTPPVAPLSNQPYLMLIQQPGVASQASAAAPSLQVNSATQALGSGWDVVCSSGWAVLLWRALVFAGARAIGAEDRARFQRELGRLDALHAPMDAPDSHAGQAALLYRQRCAQWHADRIPTNKKPNFHRNHIAHPFGLPLFELLQLGPQEECDKNYEALIAKPNPHAASNAMIAAAATVAAAKAVQQQQEQRTVDEAAEKGEEEEEKQQQPLKRTKVNVRPVADAAVDAMDVDDDTPADPAIGAVSAAGGAVSASSTAPAASQQVMQRKPLKRRPLPDTEPPYELLPLHPSFAAQHLPFFVWRSWREEWLAARSSSSQPLSLASFFASPSVAPSLCNALLAVELRCPSGGLPENSALICAPSSAAEAARMRAKSPAPLPDRDDPSLSHNERQARQTPWDVLMERNNKLKHPHPIRSSIGFLSHGWFSYQQGMGVGLGFVAAQPFAQLMAQQGVEGATVADDAMEQTSALESGTSGGSANSNVVHVWCRNQSGLAYRAAQVQLLAQPH